MWLSLLACSTPRPDEVPADTTEVVTAPWSAAEVGVQLQAALAGGLPEPWSLNEHYLTDMSHGDALCPGPDNQLIMPEGICVAESGYAYYGVATWWDTSTEDLTAFYMFTASFVITPPEGEPFRAGGSYRYDEFADGTWTGVVEGGFVDGDEDGWFATESSSALHLSGTSDSLALHGGVTTDSGVVWFESLESCGSGAAGDVAVRAPEGDWYTVSLAPDCSGCGEVRWGDQEIGDVCVDLGEVLSGLRAARTAR